MENMSNKNNLFIYGSRQNNVTGYLKIVYVLVLLFALISSYITLICYITKNKLYTDTALIYASSYLLNKGDNPYILPKNLKQLLDNKHEKIHFYAEKEGTKLADKKLKLNQTTLSNLSPPFATMIVSVFSRNMSEQHFSLLIKIFNIIANLIALYFLAYYFFKKQKYYAYLCLVLMSFAFMGTIYSFTFGEISLVLTFLLISSCFLYQNKRDLSAGAVLSFAVNLKLFFGLFIILFIAQKRYKSLMSFILLSVLFGSLPLFFYGIAPYLGYLKALSEIYWYPVNWNASYFAILTRIFGDGSGLFPSLWNVSALTHVTYYLIFICYVLFIYKFCRKLKNDSTQAFALIIPCMLLLSPLGWYYYFPLLTLSFVHFFQKIKGDSNYLAYLFIFLSLLLVLNLPVGVQTNNFVSLAYQLTSGSYFFFCLFIFHIVQSYYCLVGSKKHAELQFKSKREDGVLSQNLMLLLLSVIFITPTSVGLFDFVVHKPENKVKISFVNTQEQPFAIILSQY